MRIANRELRIVRYAGPLALEETPFAATYPNGRLAGAPPHSIAAPAIRASRFAICLSY